MEEEKIKRLRGMLGFAMRAGRVTIGTEQVIALLRRGGNGPSRIVLITADASGGTRKKITDKCDFYGAESAILPMSSEELGALLGKISAPRAVAVTDAGFTREIKKTLGKDVFAAETEEQDGRERIESKAHSALKRL